MNISNRHNLIKSSSCKQNNPGVADKKKLVFLSNEALLQQSLSDEALLQQSLSSEALTQQSLSSEALPQQSWKSMENFLRPFQIFQRDFPLA